MELDPDNRFRLRENDSESRLWIQKYFQTDETFRKLQQQIIWIKNKKNLKETEIHLSLKTVYPGWLRKMQT